MVYILYGEDDFSIHRALAEIKEGLGDAESLAVDTVSLDGEHLTLNELKHNCGASPFLSSHRLVVVNGLLNRFEPPKGRPRSARRAAKKDGKLGEWDGLAAYIKQLPPTAVLVLVDGKLGKQNPLLAKVSSLAELREFPPLKGVKLTAWVKRRVAEKGGTIAPAAMRLLTQLIGGDLWAMGNELDKLLLYAQGRAINEDDVRQLVSYAHQANIIFVLVDAVLEGQPEMAHRMLERLFREGASPGYILFMITRQLRLIIQARESGSPARLGLPPYALSRTLEQARLYGFERIKQVYDRLLQTDIDIKTGKYNDEVALELLIAELCHGETRAHPGKAAGRY
jgi:DNA polymerase-3 subunit delta